MPFSNVGLDEFKSALGRSNLVVHPVLLGPKEVNVDGIGVISGKEFAPFRFSVRQSFFHGVTFGDGSFVVIRNFSFHVTFQSVDHGLRYTDFAIQGLKLGFEIVGVDVTFLAAGEAGSLLAEAIEVEVALLLEVA